MYKNNQKEHICWRKSKSYSISIYVNTRKTCSFWFSQKNIAVHCDFIYKYFPVDFDFFYSKIFIHYDKFCFSGRIFNIICIYTHIHTYKDTYIYIYIHMCTCVYADIKGIVKKQKVFLIKLANVYNFPTDESFQRRWIALLQ